MASQSTWQTLKDIFFRLTGIYNLQPYYVVMLCNDRLKNQDN